MTARPISGVIPGEVGSAQPISLFPPTAEEVPSLGVEGDALVEEVKTALATLRQLMEHRELLGEQTATSLRLTAAQVIQRLNRTEICVVLAGEPGSGKTTFLNAIIGDRRLGDARGRSPITTLLRHGATPSFRARFADGKMQDFARLVPDRQRQMDQKLVGAEEAFEQAARRHAALALKAESAREALERDTVELERARQTVTSSREIVRSLEGMIGGAEMAAQTARAELVQVDASTPKALTVPANELSFLAWLWQAIVKLANMQRWRAHAAALRLSEEATERFEAMRQRVQQADQTCVDAEDQVLELRMALETRASQSAAAEHVLPAAEEALATARAAMDQCRGELGRYVEERQARFFSELAAIGSGRDVVELAIDYPADFLPDDVAIIDAPGVTLEREENHAWHVIREEADGCILISDLERGISAPTERFLHRLREVVPHVLLVLSKMDAAFVDAHREGQADPWDAVEKVRRARTERFAEQIGRSKDTVLSIAVAAQAAIEDPDSGLARRFEVELRKLFRVLRHERAIILGTRAAKVLRQCIAETADAEQRAEARYRDRIAALEAERVPEPEVFHRQALAKAKPGIQRGAERATAQASEAARVRFAELRREYGDRIRRSVHEGQFRAVALETETDLEKDVKSVEARALVALNAGVEQSVRELERSVFDDLRKKYHIDEEVKRKRDSIHREGVALARVFEPGERNVRSTLARHVWTRVGLGLGGALLGAGIGMLIAPGIGAAIGIAVGSLLVFAKTHRSLERRTIAMAELALRKQEQAALKDIAALTPQARTNIEVDLNRAIEDVIIRFARHIAVPYEAGEEAIARERTSLGRLRDLGEAMKLQDARLAELMADAASASRGLCQ